MAKRKLKKKGLKVLSAALSISVLAASGSFAGEWRNIDNHWKMQQENGEFVRSRWYHHTDGKWYHFDADGNLQTGWYFDTDGKWYYMNLDGSMAASQWIQGADGKWYYVDASGAMLTSRTTPDGYWVNADGSWNETVPRYSVLHKSYHADRSPDATPGEEPEETPGEEPGGGTGEEPGEEPGGGTGEEPGEEPGGGTGEEPGEEGTALEAKVARAANSAENAGAVQDGIIEFLTGRTYRYTVDTDNSREAGLTDTAVSAGEWKEQLQRGMDAGMEIVLEDASGNWKSDGDSVLDGDQVIVRDGEEEVKYTVQVKKGALKASFEAEDSSLTVNSAKDLILNFHAGQRTPDGTVVIDIPAGIEVSEDDLFVNIIGRGEVPLSELPEQSPGRWGGGYDVKVGEYELEDLGEAGMRIRLIGLDLRPDNGIDVQLRMENISVSAAGNYEFYASYQVTEPDVLESPVTSLTVNAVNTITSLERVLDKSSHYNVDTDYQAAAFRWTEAEGADSVTLLQSVDRGETWSEYAVFDGGAAEAEVEGLDEDMEYWFRLQVKGGPNEGFSNIAKLYSGMYNVRTTGGAPTDGSNAAEKIDEAIDYLNSLGGGTVLFEGGKFSTTTVHLKSNVYLYIDKSAELTALKGCDAPEVTWYSDKDYRSGTSPTSTGPYKVPENWLTKQDVGHTYWQNAMFYGQRLDNIKIIGNGRINGNGNLSTSDGVMNNSADSRADKMVALKLCTNFEMGGLSKSKDLWYEETDTPNEDEPFYLEADGSRDEDIDNMLRIARGGHFVLLATGVDGVNTHDVYAEKASGGVRDIFDYMACNDVAAVNIYAAGSSDDIVKPGSDCSLGFTRPASNYIVRNIIGDTNCNLFQIGSETADDIQDICVDNIYVLAANKAGFSISTNDGGHIKDIHLNCGGTVGECQYGSTHDELELGYEPAEVHPNRSEMRRTRAPFFLSISNRGRIMGGEAERKQFTDPNGTQRDELLSTNVNIGYVENIFINNVNVEEVYGGSQYKGTRWQEYGSQNKATPIIAGYRVPDGVGITLPDGRNVGYLENVAFHDVNVLVKGGNPIEDADNSPKEMGVGQYNVGDLAGDARGSMLPAYGFWARHVKGFMLDNCSVNFEQNDDRYAIVLDDVENASLEKVSMVKPENNRNVLELLNCQNVSMKDSGYYVGTTEGEYVNLENMEGVTVSGKQTYPNAVSALTTLKLNEKAEKQVVASLSNAEREIQVTFGAEAEELKNSILAEDDSAQSYQIYRGEDEVKTGKLQTEDCFRVTAENRDQTAEYRLIVAESTCTDLQKAAGAECVLAIDNEEKTMTVLEGTTAGELLNAIEASDGSAQTCTIQDRESGDSLNDGDRLTVTAADGKTTAEYIVDVSADIRIRAAEDTCFVQSINEQKKTIAVLKGTTPKQLASGVTAKNEDVELNIYATDSRGEVKESGSVENGDLLVVETADGADSQEYSIQIVTYQSDSITVEGETSSYQMYGAAMTTKTNSDSSAGAGGNRQFENCAVGDYVEITIPDLAAGKYDLIYTYKTANNNRRGIIGASFNGTELEGEADANDTVANLYRPFSYGNVIQEADGDAVVRLTVVAPGTGSAPYNFIVDRLELKGNPSPNTNLAAAGGKILEVDNDEKILTMMRNSAAADALEAEAADGSKQTYELMRGGEVLTEGELEDGDLLIVTAEDGEHTETYTIRIDETAISNELTFAAVHWISGEPVIEPGTTVEGLEEGDLITADFGLAFKVTSGDRVKAQEEWICDGDLIEISNEKTGEVVRTITADVSVESPFAEYDYEAKKALLKEIDTNAEDVKASSDTITSDTSLRVPYVQGGKTVGNFVSIDAELPAAGKYRLEVVYKSGSRSKKVAVTMAQDETVIDAGTIDVAASGTLWLADMEGRNTSKTYVQKEICTESFAEGPVTVTFTNQEAADMVLIEVRLALVGEAADHAEEEDILFSLQKETADAKMKQKLTEDESERKEAEAAEGESEPESEDETAEEEERKSEEENPDEDVQESEMEAAEEGEPESEDEKTEEKEPESEADKAEEGQPESEEDEKTEEEESESENM